MIPESYLMHHGVDGQKWGIQNGPPYPLDRAGRRALRAQRRQAKKDLSKAVAAESLNAGTLSVVMLRMRNAKTQEEYQRYEKVFDELSKQQDTLLKYTQKKASELLKMNAGKNIKYANYKLYMKNNDQYIESTKNSIDNYMKLRSEYLTKDQHDIVANGRNIINRYVSTLN